MQTLVTGGGGFLGRYIVERLLDRGDDVRIFSRSRYPELENQGVECLTGDLRDADAVAAACAGRDAVFHTAAVPGVWGPWSLYYETNTVGTRNVVAGCRQHAVSKLVYTSSPSVVYDGRPHEGADESLPYPRRFRCHYPHSKALAEQAVLAANDPATLRTIALRPHLIWGPRDNHLLPRLILRVKSGRLRRIGNGVNRVSMSYVENVAAAHIQACDALAAGLPCAGRAYFINEPEPVRLWDWVADLLARAGLPPVQRSVPYPVAYGAGAVLEGLFTLVRFPYEPIMTRFVASQLATSHWYRIDAAIHDFGYAPPVSTDEGLRRTEPDLRRWAAEL
ncbi:MAG: NAD-dependent epimerase/dehydratase family protein [Planctomyces sp.]|nr:NAD-dependent epimerase/dehydratase family protein [Planctomyces sp.]